MCWQFKKNLQTRWELHQLQTLRHIFIVSILKLVVFCIANFCALLISVRRKS